MKPKAKKNESSVDGRCGTKRIKRAGNQYGATLKTRGSFHVEKKKRNKLEQK